MTPPRTSHLLAIALVSFGVALPLFCDRLVYDPLDPRVLWLGNGTIPTKGNAPSHPTSDPVAPSNGAVPNSATITIDFILTPPASITPVSSSPPASFPGSPYTVSSVTTSSLSTTTSVLLGTARTTDVVSGSVNVGPQTASTTNTCEGANQACRGDVTYWDGGMSACGWNVNSTTDYQIALPASFMGTQSNGNPYCGRLLTLYNPISGATMRASVGDKCGDCMERSIDCTVALFAAIVPDGDGRVSGIEWWLDESPAQG